LNPGHTFYCIEIWEHIEELVPIPPYAVVAPVSGPLRTKGGELNVWVVERAKGVEIPPAQRVINAPHDLDVLL
jgi:hypothetical protein